MARTAPREAFPIDWSGGLLRPCRDRRAFLMQDWASEPPPCQHVFRPACATGLSSFSPECPLPGKFRLPGEAAWMAKGVRERVRELRALHLASWTHRCSQTHRGVKGMLQQPFTTRNVGVIFSVPWNILISRRLQGGIQIAPGFNWHTLYLLLVIFLLIFFSFHQFLIDFRYGKPCVRSCEFKGAEIQMLLIDGHHHRKIIYAELVWLFPNYFLLH